MSGVPRLHSIRRFGFRDLPLSAKFALVPGLTLLLISVMLLLALRMNADHAGVLIALDRNVFEPLNRAQTLKDEITLLHTRLFALLAVNTDQVNPTEQTRQATEVAARLRTVEDDVDDFLRSSLPIPPADADAIRTLFDAYTVRARETINFASYDLSYAALVTEATDQDFGRLRTELDALVQRLSDRRKALAAKAVDDSRRAQRLLLGVDVIGTALVVLGAMLVGPAITTPLLDLIHRLDRLAGGDTDLTVPGVDRRDEVGSMARAVEVFRENLIARRRGEEMLRRMNMRFDGALNSMQHGLMVWGPDRCIQLVNNRFLQLFGLAADDIPPGQTIEEHVTTLHAKGMCTDLEAGTLRAAIAEHVTSGRLSVAEQAYRTDLIVRVVSAPMSDGGTVTTFEDVTEKRRGEKQIRYLAHHDSLTGLPNRAVFQTRIEKLDAADHGNCVILCLDLDRFKDVNDTLGHPAGDEMLRLVARRLCCCVREGDMVARLGGDEFAILMTDVEEGLKVVAPLAERMLEAVSAPYDLQGQQVVLGASIGIALSEPGLAGAEVLKRADVALYQAKAEKGTYAVFEPGMDEQLRARKALEAELRLALQREEFELHYQPQYSLVENRVSGFEALLRWQSPTRGAISPVEFIPLAEETGLIVPIGAWVLRAACAAAAAWSDTICVAVNVSARQMRDDALLGVVRSALHTAGLPARRLEIEITETALLKDTAAARRVLDSLHEMGVRLALDDFGTGYSSLSYLRQFPFDKLKIDRSFIKDIQHAPDEDAAGCGEPSASAVTIVRAIVGLGQNLGLSTTAEGVETIPQLMQMQRTGCTEVQGFLISSAVPEGQISSLLQRLVTVPPQSARTMAREPA